MVCARVLQLTKYDAVQDHVISPVSKAEYNGEPRSLQEAWAAGDMAVYPYAKSLATKTSISGLVIQKEWVQSLMEPNGAYSVSAHSLCAARHALQCALKSLVQGKGQMRRRCVLLWHVCQQRVANHWASPSTLCKGTDRINLTTQLWDVLPQLRSAGLSYDCVLYGCAEHKNNTAVNAITDNGQAWPITFYLNKDRRELRGPPDGQPGGWANLRRALNAQPTDVAVLWKEYGQVHRAFRLSVLPKSMVPHGIHIAP